MERETTKETVGRNEFFGCAIEPANAITSPSVITYFAVSQIRRRNSSFVEGLFISAPINFEEKLLVSNIRSWMYCNIDCDGSQLPTFEIDKSNGANIQGTSLSDICICWQTFDYTMRLCQNVQAANRKSSKVFSMLQTRLAIQISSKHLCSSSTMQLLT